MTMKHNADRVIIDWLTADRGTVDAEQVDLAVARAASLEQRRRVRAALLGSGSWPARPTFGLSRLPPAARIAIVLGLATMVVAGGLLAAGAGFREPPADPRPGTDLDGTWLAYRPAGMGFGFPSGPSPILSLHLELTEARAVVNDDSVMNPLLASTVELGPDGVLSFTTTTTVLVDRSHPQGDAVVVDGALLENCLKGDIGRCRPVLDGDGSALTLIAEVEACGSRGAVVARTWMKGFGAASDGGAAIVSGFPELLTLDLPAGAYEVTSLSSLFVARGDLADGRPFTVFVMRNARDELRTDCQEPWAAGEEIGLGRQSVQALGQRRPMLVGAVPDPRDDRSIGGLNAIHLSYRRGCKDGGTVLWGGGDDPAYRIGLPDGQAASLWFIDRGGDLWVVGTLMADSPESGYPDRPEEGQVLDSIQWLSR